MFKRILLLLTLVFAIFSCEVTSEDANSVKSNDENAEASIKANVLPSGGEYVKLVKTFCDTQSGSPDVTTRTYIILVKNVSATKEVYVHQERLSGQTWQDLTADYVGPADSSATYEVWKAEVSFDPSNSPYGDEFVAKYIVSGSTYWDNNNGNNYTIGTNDGSVLYNDLNVDLYEASYDSTSGLFEGSITVKNIAYTKYVDVVYTTDNWSTQSVINASYGGDPWGTSNIDNPNSYGFEMWDFSANIGTSLNIKYYIRYTVNGVTYYDNNYSKDYVAP